MLPGEKEDQKEPKDPKEREITREKERAEEEKKEEVKEHGAEETDVYITVIRISFLNQVIYLGEEFIKNVNGLIKILLRQ